MCHTLPQISRGNLAAFQASHSPSATWMFHGHVSVAEARALFLVMVVIVGSGLYVGPLLRTYPESASTELGMIRSLHGCWCTAVAGTGRCFDQVVGRTTKAKNNTRNMSKFPEKNVTMTHAEVCWVKTEECKVGLGKELGLVLWDRARSTRPVVAFEAWSFAPVCSSLGDQFVFQPPILLNKTSNASRLFYFLLTPQSIMFPPRPRVCSVSYKHVLYVAVLQSCCRRVVLHNRPAVALLVSLAGTAAESFN